MIVKMKINQIDFDKLNKIGAITQKDIFKTYLLFNKIEVEPSPQKIDYSKNVNIVLCDVEIDIVKKMTHKVYKSQTLWENNKWIDDFILCTYILDNTVSVISKHVTYDLLNSKQKKQVHDLYGNIENK